MKNTFILKWVSSVNTVQIQVVLGHFFYAHVIKNCLLCYSQSMNDQKSQNLILPAMAKVYTQH